MDYLSTRKNDSERLKEWEKVHENLFLLKLTLKFGVDFYDKIIMGINGKLFNDVNNWQDFFYPIKSVYDGCLDNWDWDLERLETEQGI